MDRAAGVVVVRNVLVHVDWPALSGEERVDVGPADREWEAGVDHMTCQACSAVSQLVVIRHREARLDRLGQGHTWNMGRGWRTVSVNGRELIVGLGLGRIVGKNFGVPGPPLDGC